MEDFRFRLGDSQRCWDGETLKSPLILRFYHYETYHFMRRRRHLQENDKIRKGKQGRSFYVVSKKWPHFVVVFLLKSLVGDKGGAVIKWLFC